MSNTCWDLCERVCPRHGETLHAIYVYDAQGRELECIENAEPSRYGRVTLECTWCQCETDRNGKWKK
jgi:hypothetical protein